MNHSKVIIESLSDHCKRKIPFPNHDRDISLPLAQKCSNPMDVKVSANKAISKVLRELMDDYGLKRGDLERRTGFSSSTVTRHLNGKFLVSEQDRAAYAEIFGMLPEDFEALWRRERQAMQAGQNQFPSPPAAARWLEYFAKGSSREQGEVIGLLGPSAIKSLAAAFAAKAEHMPADAPDKDRPSKFDNAGGVRTNKGSQNPAEGEQESRSQFHKPAASPDNSTA